MATENHSPGPWKVQMMPMNPNPRIIASDGSLVAVVSEGKPFARPTKANAKMIAAATDLADAHQKRIDEWHADDRNFHREEPESLTMARAALKKAGR